MKRGFILLLVFFMLIAIGGILSADFGDLSHLIDTSYGPGDTLRGWINISLTNEPSNSVFESLFENSDGEIDAITASLKKLIDGDEDFEHTCIPTSCLSDYGVTDEGDMPKTFTLDAGNSTILGFKVSGSDITDVSDFSIDGESGAGASSSPQLLIDVLNNEEKVWKPHIISGNFGDDIYSECYDSGDALAGIIQLQYCQKITIPPAPNIEIGANLIGTATVEFKMSIRSMDYIDYGECYITASGDGSESCEPEDFVVNEEQDYFVCIKAIDSEDNFKYEINSETTNPCGYAGVFYGNYEIDFEIFVKPGTYGAVGSFILDNTEISDIEIDIADYLSLTYGNKCSDGCIVPIKITSMVDGQTIDISDAVLSYRAGAAFTVRSLYNLSETPAKINAEMQKLLIDAGKFKVPNEYDNHTINLSFKGEVIFSEEITVERVPIIKFMDQTITAMNYPTTFIVEVESESNISLYEWDFGNNDTKITTTNKTTYTYNTTGDYTLTVTVTDMNGRSSSKTFIITVGSASEITGILLQKGKENLGLIKDQIKEFSQFEQETIGETLGLDIIEIILDTVEIAPASSEADYQAILQELMNISVPEMIYLSATADSVLFYPEKTNINVRVLTEITGESYESSKESKYADAVLGWNIQNVDITVTHKEITSSFENYAESLNFFEVDVTKKAGSEEDSYIVLREMEGLIFDGDPSEIEEDGYIYLPLIEESKKIVFATTENVGFIDLPLFVSPAVSKLTLVDFDFSPMDESGKLKKWVLFSLIMLLLIIIGVVFWVFLHAWYKKKYEDYLFKNKNNLYNLFNWIENAKKRGLEQREIRSRLRKSGWTSEQLRYVLRKHRGKRTGMPGIPISKIIKRSRGKRSMPQGKFPGSQ